MMTSMSTDRPFIDHCPLPDNVIYARPDAWTVEFPWAPPDAVALGPRGNPSDAWESHCYRLAAPEPVLYCYPIGGRWVDQRYAWHEASRTVVVWPSQAALDTVSELGL